MAEVTRVPLQPIAKGSLTKLWIGVIIAVLLAGGIAWAAQPGVTRVSTITAGAGAFPGETDVVFVRYTGKLADGTVFDESQDIPLPIPEMFPAGAPLPLDQMVPGFKKALVKTQKGGKYEIFIPAREGYGDDVPPGGPIPPGSDLYFDIEVVDFMPRAEFDRRVGMYQQLMMQQQQGQMGGPEGAPPPPPPPAE